MNVSRAADRKALALFAWSQEMRSCSLHTAWKQSLGVAAGVIATMGATTASALPSQGIEVVVRHATEPSTGSMVFAAIVALAVVHRKRTPTA